MPEEIQPGEKFDDADKWKKEFLMCFDAYVLRFLFLPHFRLQKFLPSIENCSK